MGRYLYRPIDETGHEMCPLPYDEVVPAGTIWMCDCGAVYIACHPNRSGLNSWDSTLADNTIDQRVARLKRHAEPSA